MAVHSTQNTETERAKGPMVQIISRTIDVRKSSLRKWDGTYGKLSNDRQEGQRLREPRSCQHTHGDRNTFAVDFRLGAVCCRAPRSILRARGFANDNTARHGGTHNPMVAPRTMTKPTMTGVTLSLNRVAAHPPIGKERMNAP